MKRSIRVSAFWRFTQLKMHIGSATRTTMLLCTIFSALSHYLTCFMSLSLQVFCCIAIVGAAIMYWTFLSFRQLLAGPRKDLSVSKLPVPPRALTGNTPQPVWGHTSMFQKHGGDIALFFPPDWREWKFLPKSWSRPLGDCFSIFIWGQWRVVIKGRERVNLILESRGLKEGWAWSPPLTLLGKSCL